MTEHRYWKWFAVLCTIVAIPQSMWAPSRVAGIFFGALAVCCFGESYFVYHSKKSKMHENVAWMGRVLFGLFIASMVMVQTVIIEGMGADIEAGEADAVLVLGARVYENGEPSATLAERLDTALIFLEEHPQTIAVLCGGKGANEPFPEAIAMRDYLLARGVSEDRLILESLSSNTIQNVANAKELLDARLGENYRTAVITSDFHLARARRLLLHAGLEPLGVPAKTPYLTQRIALHLREYGSIMGLALTGRW